MTITLKDVGSGFKRTAINENFETIETELNTNVLKKGGGTQLEAHLDLNSNKLLNVSAGSNNTDGVNFGQMNAAIAAAGTLETSDTSIINHTQSGTDYNLATYLQNNREVNVKDFGAVGDGVTDDTAAILLAIAACDASRLEGNWTSELVLKGEGRFLISSQLDITGLNVDFSRAVIILGDNFPTSPAIIGHNLFGNAGATRDIKLSIDGNRANQSSTIVSVGFTNFNWTGSHVHIHGEDCQTLVRVDGNTEGIQFLLTGFNIERVVEEDINGGLTPDENEYKIITNTTGDLYVQLQASQGTSSHLILNCEQAGMLLSANSPLVDITTAKTVKVEGLLRGTWATPVRVDSGTSSIIRFDLEVYGLASVGYDTLNSPAGTVKALDVVECGKLFGFYEVHSGGDDCTADIYKVNRGGNLTLSNNVDSGIAVQLGDPTDASNSVDGLRLVTYGKTSVGGKELVVNRTNDGSIDVLNCFYGIDIDPNDISSSGGNYRTPISIPATVFVNDIPITTTDTNTSPWTGDITCHSPVTASLITGYSTPINGLTCKERLTRTYYTYSNGAWTKPTMGAA